MSLTSFPAALFCLVMLLLGGGVPGAAQAASAGESLLRVGTIAVPATTDPHVRLTTSSLELARHLHGALTRTDAQGHVDPELAVSWVREGATRWVFRLRSAIHYPDAKPFGPEDVVFSLCRAMLHPQGTRAFKAEVEQIDTVRPGSDLTLRIITRLPDVDLPRLLARIPIIRQPDGWAGRVEGGRCDGTFAYPMAAFDDLSLHVGIGPYRLTRFAANEFLAMERNPAAWWAPPYWDRIEIERADQNERTAGLLRGRFDIVDGVGKGARDYIEALAHVRSVYGALNGLMHLQLNHRETGVVGGIGGSANPLRDVRVRRAMSMALDRAAIADRLIDGIVVPTSRLDPTDPGCPGEAPPLSPADATAARELLSEAGYPEGFALELLVQPGHARIGAAITRMLGSIGIQTTLAVLDNKLFVDRLQASDFQIALISHLRGGPDAALTIRRLAVCPGAMTGAGASNHGAYCNPRLDDLIRAADTVQPDSADKDMRRQLVCAAVRLVDDELPILTLLHRGVVWQLRQGLDFTPRTDNTTLSWDIRPLQE